MRNKNPSEIDYKPFCFVRRFWVNTIHWTEVSRLKYYKIELYGVLELKLTWSIIWISQHRRGQAFVLYSVEKLGNKVPNSRQQWIKVQYTFVVGKRGKTLKETLRVCVWKSKRAPTVMNFNALFCGLPFLALIWPKNKHPQTSGPAKPAMVRYYIILTKRMPFVVLCAIHHF